MCQSYYGHNFEMLMLLAGFVNADTAASTKFKILEDILDGRAKASNYPEQFEKNLMGLSISEVEEWTYNQFKQTFCVCTTSFIWS